MWYLVLKKKWGGERGVKTVELDGLFFNSTFKKAGKDGIWVKYSGSLGNNGDIWGKYCGIWGKHGGIRGKVVWYLGKHKNGGGERRVMKSGFRTPILTHYFKRRGRGLFGTNTVVL